MPWGPHQCDKIQSFDDAMAKKIEANNIVFAIHIPLPHKQMSPWFQFIVVILQFDIAFKLYNQVGKNKAILIFKYLKEGRGLVVTVSSKRLSCLQKAEKQNIYLRDYDFSIKLQKRHVLQAYHESIVCSWHFRIV